MLIVTANDFDEVDILYLESDENRRGVLFSKLVSMRILTALVLLLIAFRLSAQNPQKNTRW